MKVAKLNALAAPRPEEQNQLLESMVEEIHEKLDATQDAHEAPPQTVAPQPPANEAVTTSVNGTAADTSTESFAAPLPSTSVLDDFNVEDFRADSSAPVSQPVADSRGGWRKEGVTDRTCALEQTPTRRRAHESRCLCDSTRDIQIGHVDGFEEKHDRLKLVLDVPAMQRAIRGSR